MTTTPPEASASDATAPPADLAGGPTGGPAEGHADGPRVTSADLKDVTRLRRTTGPDRHLAGVSGGLARFFDVDPRLVRVLMVVLALFGVGVLLYLALWLLLPDDAGGRAVIDLDPRSLAVALVLVTALLLLPVVAGNPWQSFWVFGPLLLLAALVAALVQSRSTRSATPAPGATPYGAEYGAAHGLQTGLQTGTAATGLQTALPTGPAPTGLQAGPTDPTGTLPPGAVPPWTPAPVPPRPPRPPDPRKKGPVLFWVTLALVSLGLGILGVVDLAGQGVAPSAYPALGLAICAVMLLLGSFFGRAGGIILLGLMLALGLTVTTVAEHAYDRETSIAPLSAGDVSDNYWTATGTFTLDLTQVADPDELDGRHLEVTGGWAHVTVIVPDDADVRARAQVGWPGQSTVFGHTQRRGNSNAQRHRVPSAEASFWVNVGIGGGTITIRTEGESR